MARGRFGNRISPRFAGRANKPTRQWAAVNGEFLFTNITVTTATTLVQLQAPTALNALTSDPPEDLTILRIRGSFACTLAGAAATIWTLALTVQDTVWTPGTTFLVDSDKRMLWSRTFHATNATSDIWAPPGTYIASGSGATALASHPNATDLDIAPKVKIETGRALFLVAYENAGAGNLSVVSGDMRILFQRSRRR